MRWWMMVFPAVAAFAASARAQDADVCEIAIRGAQARSEMGRIALEYSADSRRIVTAMLLAADNDAKLSGFADVADDQQTQLANNLEEAIGPLRSDIDRLRALCSR